MVVPEDWIAAAATVASIVATLTGVGSAAYLLYSYERSRKRRDFAEAEILAGNYSLISHLQNRTTVALDHGLPKKKVEEGEPPQGEKERAPGPEEVQVALLQRYHAQGLGQASISFVFSIVFAGIGFVIIAAGALAAYANDVNWTKAVLPIVSGTVIDAAAGLIFVQTNKARENMAEFFDRLRADNKLAQALQLANEIGDAKVSANLKAYLSMHFAGVNVDLNSYRSVIGLPASLKSDLRAEAYSDGAAPAPAPRKRGAKADVAPSERGGKG